LYVINHTVKDNKVSYLFLLLALPLILLLAASGGPFQKGYDRIGPYKNGRAKVFKGDKIGFINQSGEEVIPCIYTYIGDFINQKAKVIREEKEGYITYEGEEFIPCKYDKIGPFKNGIARTFVKGKVGLITLEGEELVPPVYDFINDFNSKGIAKAQFDRKPMLLNMRGETVEPEKPQWQIDEEEAE